MGVTITVKGANYEQIINAGDISAYVTKLATVYNLLQKEEDALALFAEKTIDILPKAKCLYLFIGDSAVAQGLNALDPTKLTLSFKGAGTHTKLGFGLGKGICADTGYAPTGAELQDFSFVCFGKELKASTNGANGTFIGMRKGPSQDRFTLTYAGGTQKRLYYVPGVGDWSTQQIALPAENSTGWIGASMDSATIELYAEGYKTSKATFGLINNTNSIYIGGENQGGGVVDISGFVSGNMQVVGMFSKLSEAEVITFVKALEALNVSLGR